jgi:hypothetical protein
MLKLRTQRVRGLAVAALVIGCAASIWRYAEQPPGDIIVTSASTQRVSNSPRALFGPDTRTAEERADKSWYFDMSLNTWGTRCGRNYINPGSAWPQDVSVFIIHWGVFLCNEAQAPDEFLDEMRPYLRDAAIRDIKYYSIRAMAIPFFGLLAASAFLLLSLGALRIGRWIKTGF